MDNPTVQPVVRPTAPPSRSQPILDNLSLRFVLNKAPQFLITYSSITAAYKSRSDPWTLAFILTAYVTIMLFFHFVNSFETTPEEKKHRVKVIVFVLALILIVLFPAKLTQNMHFALSALIWTMGGVTISTIYYLFFIYVPEKQ